MPGRRDPRRPANGHGREFGPPRRPPFDPDDPYRRAPGDGAGARHFRSPEPDDEDDDGPLLSRRGNPRRTRGQRTLLGLLVSLVLAVGAAAGVAGYTLQRYESIERVRDIKIAEAPKGEPENFLLVGSDTREGTADAEEVGGQRSDTIMVLRVDPQSDRLSLVSFPRDLMLQIPALGRRGQINSAYELENGEQALIDTINQNFGIPINHYVEVNFNGFKQLTDAVGGVNLFFPNAVRDDQTGLFVEQLGCVNLNGEQALAFARSRHLEYRAPDGWKSDLYADLSRVQRQQIFIRRALTKALTDVKSNPLRIQQLIDIGVGNVRLDGEMGVGDIVDLANQFKDFSAEKLETYPLPVLDDPNNSNRVIVDDSKAEPILNVFRGVDPGEVSPSSVTVKVLNGTDKSGLANDASGALQTIGFEMLEAGDSLERPAHSVVYHAPGQGNVGLRVARHLTGGADVKERPDVPPGQVELVLGADFTTVHDQPTPIEEMPTTTVAGVPAPAAPVTTVAPTTTAPPTTLPPTTTTTASNGYIVGEPPAGTSC